MLIDFGIYKVLGFIVLEFMGFEVYKFMEFGVLGFISYRFWFLSVLVFMGSMFCLCKECRETGGY